MAPVGGAPHFTYHEKPSSTELLQGDVIARTSALNAVLRQVHPHFDQKDSNLYFMVLTQSCDLVLRQGGGCKARYLTICPVRSLDGVLAREIEQHQLEVRADAPVMTDKAKNKLSEFLHRRYNNNEQGYFYLEAAGTDLSEDCCAVLGLSIPIKADLHYQTCVDAKILQLEDSFQAKLGWLIAQMYARVGTRDWDRKDLEGKVKATLNGAGIFVPDAKAGPLSEHFRGLVEADPTTRMTGVEIKRALDKMPTRKSKLLSRTTSILEAVIPDPALRNRIVKRLEGDVEVTAILK